MILLIVFRHHRSLNYQHLDLRICWIKPFLLTQSRVKKICELSIRIIFLHLFKHLQKLKGLSLREVNVTVQLLSYILDYLTISLVRQTKTEFSVYTVDNHWVG